MKLKFIERKDNEGDVKSFIFGAVEQLSWTPGQFLIYFLPHENPDIRGKQRFFTISSAPFEKHVMLSTRIFEENRSSFKKVLMNLKSGDEVEVKGPDGDFTVDLPAQAGNPNQKFVFIAGGIGITPFRSIIQELNNEEKPLNITLLYANSNEQFAFKKEFEEIAKTNPNFKINYIVSPKHIDKGVIKNSAENIDEPIFYISGPEPMVESLVEMLKKMGIPEDHIKTDYFPGYEAF